MIEIADNGMGIPADRLVVKPHFMADGGRRTEPPSASGDVLFIGRLAPGKGLHTLVGVRKASRAYHRVGSLSHGGNL